MSFRIGDTVQYKWINKIRKSFIDDYYWDKDLEVYNRDINSYLIFRANEMRTTNMVLTEKINIKMSERREWSKLFETI